MDSAVSKAEGQVIEYEKNRLHENVPFLNYVAAEGINAHGLMDILRSPAHFYEAKFNAVKQNDTEALLFGRLLHCAILEPELFKANYIVEPKLDKRTKIGREEYEKWESKLTPSSIIVPEVMVDKLVKMSEKIMNHKIAGKILMDGGRELTMFWNDKETGELCKLRTDCMTNKGVYVDLKSTQDAREEFFWREVKKRYYDLQVAHYLSGARETGIGNSEAFVFIAIEKTPPYEIAVYPVGPSILAFGDRLRTKAMRVYAKCKRENKWPGYNPDARVLEYPDWVMSNELYEDEENDQES